MTEPLEQHLLQQQAQHQITFWHRVRAKAVLEALPAGARPTVADIGAGAGTLGWILQAERPDAAYTYYEPIAGLADRLSDDFGAEARLPTADDVGRADVVTLLDVVEHIEDAHGFLAPIVEAMASGAHLVVTVPALQALWSQWDVALGHHRRYNRNQLRELVAPMPLIPSEVSWLFPELLPPAALRRLLSSRRAVSDGSADFPVFPPVIDRLLFRASSASFAIRRYAPAGTSVLLVGRRR